MKDRTSGKGRAAAALAALGVFGFLGLGGAAVLGAGGCGGGASAGGVGADGGGADAPSTDASTGDGGGQADVQVDGAIGQDAGPEVAAAPPWCEGATHALYDPVAGAELQTFPDDYLTVDDADSRTGLHVDLSPARAPWAAELPESVSGNLADMDRLSGFGLLAGVLLRFDAPLDALPQTADESLTSDGLIFMDLDADPPARVPYEAELSNEDKDLVLWPLRPLRPGARYGVVLTTAYAAADGGCVSPAAATRALLTGTATDAGLTRLAGRYDELLQATGLAPEEVSAATVFTTADDIPILAAVAADVATRTYDWSQAPVCTREGWVQRCEGKFLAYDYRNGAAILDAIPVATPWELPVTVWIPDGAVTPAPLVIYGHGIGSSRYGGEGTAWQLRNLGVIVAATDALYHGQHPTVPDGWTDQDAVMTVLGLNLSPVGVDAWALRGNFNQSTVDRLQLLQLLMQHPDIDGDGTPDLDVSRLAYRGISMGSMMGASAMALSDDLQVGVLSVVGGRLLRFVTNHPQVAPFLPALYDFFGGEAMFYRLLTVLEPAMDLGDPAVWAAHTLRARPSGSPHAPNLLVELATHDETVPPINGRAFARALSAPLVGAERDPIALIPKEPALPVSGNITDEAGDARTAGVFQYDRVTGSGGVEAATHNGTPGSPEESVQIKAFLLPWLDGGLPELVDPYQVLNTAPL